MIRLSILFNIVLLIFGCDNNQNTEENNTKESHQEDAIENTTFEKFLGDNYNVGNYIQDTDTSIIVVGAKYNNDADGSRDIWIVSINNSGKIVWGKTVCKGKYFLPRSIIKSPNGNYLIAGQIKSENQINHRSLIDIYLIEIDQYGKLIWEKTYTANTRFETKKCMLQTIDNSILIVSNSVHYYDDINFTDQTAFTNLYKINIHGDLLWRKEIQRKCTDGGVFAAVSCTDGGFLFAGNDCDDFLDKTAWTFKTDINGNLLWSKYYRELQGLYLIDIIKCDDNSYWVAGEQLIGEQKHAWISKIDDFGNVMWDTIYSEKRRHLHLSSLYLCADKGLLIVGSQETLRYGTIEALIIKTDANGKEEWRRIFDDKDFLYIDNIMQLSDGSIFTLGRVYLGNQKRKDWIMKLNESGRLEE